MKKKFSLRKRGTNISFQSDLLQDEPVPALYEPGHGGPPHGGRLGEDEAQCRGLGDRPEGSEEVCGLAGEAVAGVEHVEEEGELACQAGLPGTEVVQDYHSQLLREVEHLEGARKQGDKGQGGYEAMRLCGYAAMRL